MSKKLNLPNWAFEYRHPAAERGDIGAQFRGDDGGSICVYLERREGGGIGINTDRSGMAENVFTPEEFARVAELIQILDRFIGASQPEPDELEILTKIAESLTVCNDPECECSGLHHQETESLLLQWQSIQATRRAVGHH